MARSPRPNRPLFPSGPGVGLRAFVFAIVAAGLWLADQRGVGVLASARDGVSRAIHPLLALSASPGQVAGASRQFQDKQAVLAENLRLKAELQQLRFKLLRFASLDAENQRIRALMTSAQTRQQKVLIAEVLAVSQEPYVHQIVLDKGGKDGVYQGQALVDGFGIMGQVISVQPSRATALLVTDPGHGIPVEINRTGLQTIARGGDTQGLVLPFLPGNADVRIGDLIVTSGLGGRFPAGYPVGQIVDVKRGTGAHFMQANAFPSAHLDQTRQVLLLWGGPEVLALAATPSLPSPASLAAQVAAAMVGPQPAAATAAVANPPLPTAPGATTPATASPPIASPASAASAKPPAVAPAPVAALPPSATAKPAASPATTAPPRLPPTSPAPAAPLSAAPSAQEHP